MGLFVLCLSNFIDNYPDHGEKGEGKSSEHYLMTAIFPGDFEQSKVISNNRKKNRQCSKSLQKLLSLKNKTSNIYVVEENKFVKVKNNGQIYNSCV